MKYVCVTYGPFTQRYNFFLYWVEHISGHIRILPACNRGYDNHFIVLSYWNITPQVQSYDIRNRLTSFALNYSLYVECLTREIQLPIWNLWFDSAGNRTWASQTWSKHSTTRLPLWYTAIKKLKHPATWFKYYHLNSQTMCIACLFKNVWYNAFLVENKFYIVINRCTIHNAEVIVSLCKGALRYIKQLSWTVRGVCSLNMWLSSILLMFPETRNFNMNIITYHSNWSAFISIGSERNYYICNCMFFMSYYIYNSQHHSSSLISCYVSCPLKVLFRLK